ncbi:MAG: dihydroorotase [Hyphomonadaceae bacterium]|nr:MAG: dihydroorotase [Caulobacteraceae bacterium]MBT9445011.1 dihydroorotase [Hyphomonadaceae bacterium]
MSAFDLIVRGGVIVNHAGRGEGDIGVRDGKIAAIGNLRTASAGSVIDAKGLHVLPGVIDTQVHFREPGKVYKEDLESGSRAAALGGVVAVFEMPNTDPATTTLASLEDKLTRAKGRMHVDHAFYAGAAVDNVDALVEMERVPGCCGVKIFMGASTGSLLVQSDEDVTRILAAVKRRVAVHSEDEYRMKERAGLVRPGDWTSHPEVRDPESALNCTRRLLAIARRLRKRIHVLHVSTADELPLLAEHRDVATVEVLPNHLTLAAPEAYERLKGKAQQNPPIRDAHHRDALWEAVRNGLVDVLGSDHAPHTAEEKAKPYPQSPSGTPGVQTLVPVMLTHVAEGRLTLERFVDLTSAAPQRVFQLAGKGRLALGYDADLTLVDLDARRTITDAQQASRSAWTPFDGMTAKGWPMATIVRGRVVMRDDEIVDAHAGTPMRFLETL